MDGGTVDLHDPAETAERLFVDLFFGRAAQGRRENRAGTSSASTGLSRYSRADRRPSAQQDPWFEHDEAESVGRLAEVPGELGTVDADPSAKAHGDGETEEERIAMLNEERRKDGGRLGDLHPSCNVGFVATRPVIEQYGRKGAGTSSFPEVRFEMQRSARKLNSLGDHAFLGLAESHDESRKRTGRYWFFMCSSTRKYTSKNFRSKRGGY